MNSHSRHLAKALPNPRPERGSPGLLTDTISPSSTIWVLARRRERVTKTKTDIYTCMCRHTHTHMLHAQTHTGACMHTDLREAPRAYINTDMDRDRDRQRTREKGKEERRRQSTCTSLRNLPLGYTLRSESYADSPLVAFWVNYAISVSAPVKEG